MYGRQQRVYDGHSISIDAEDAGDEVVGQGVWGPEKR